MSLTYLQNNLHLVMILCSKMLHHECITLSRSVVYAFSVVDVSRVCVVGLWEIAEDEISRS